MRILVACDAPPYPLANGQNLRIYHYVHQLQGQHSFDLLCLSDKPAPEPLRGMFGKIVVLPPFAPPSTDARKSQRLTLSPQQLVLPHPSLRATLRTLAASGAYDLIWFSGGGTMNPHFDRRPGVAVLADVVDSLALTQWRELLRAAGPVAKLRHAKRFLTTCLFERTAFRRSDRALFVSEADARMFQRVGGGVPTDVIHNGVDESFFAPAGSPAREPVVAFEGNMGFVPNVEAAQWLCRHVMPRLWAAEPAARAILIGKDPSPEVRALASDRVEVTGTLDDIRPALRRAAVFACPMQSGAGIKNKILQAWSMGMPVVATSMATGGLEAADGVNLLVRESAEDFAQGVLQLLRDPSLADQIGGAARKTIVEKYSWSRKAQELSTCFERALSSARSRGAR